MKKILYSLLILFTLQVHAQTAKIIAGTGTMGYNGAGLPALSTEFWNPGGIAFDKKGYIYIADITNQLVRKIDSLGNVITIAGVQGQEGYNGDGIAATSAYLSNPIGLAFDTAGNLYIADQFNERIRKVDAAGIITTVAGTGTNGYNGDGIAATAAELSTPSGVAFDAAGNFYSTDQNGARIREVNTKGIISTVVGTGTSGYSGDGGAATNATIERPYGIYFDQKGNMFITDVANATVRKIDNTGTITTFAGTGTTGYNGDGILATEAQLSTPEGIASDAAGNVYIADGSNDRIRVVNTSGTINTYVGSTGKIIENILFQTAVNIDACGNLYFLDGNLGNLWEVADSSSASIYTKSPTICNGQKTTLDVIGYGNFTWSPSTGLSATSGDSVIANPTATTTYTVSTTGCLASNSSIIITVNTSTPITIQPLSPTICSGQSIKLVADGGDSILVWSPATGLSATSGDNVIANPTSTITYTVSTSAACFLPATDVVTVISAPPLTILPPSPYVCSGQSTTLIVNGGGSNFVWSPATGLSATSGDTVTANPTTNVTYSVTGIDSVGCPASGSDVVTIVPAPNIPTITTSVTGDSLISSATSDNQWYFNDVLIPDSTAQVLIIKGHAKGWYSVTVTNEANGCSTTSDSTTSIEQLSVNSEQLSVYPNPNNGSFNIQLQNLKQNAQIQIFNVLGEKIYTAQLNSSHTLINLNTPAQGIYLYRVLDEQGNPIGIGKFIIE